MATLGNVPAEAYTNTVKDSFSGNGSATAFTMSLPTVTNDVRVVVENVIQDPTVAYSVSGTTLTFTSAPPTGTNNIYVVHLGPAVMTTVPPAEIADATTFASSLTVQGAFTSKGIDDNADAVALTIDSSENVMLGTTTSTLYNVSSGTGFSYRNGVALDIARQNTSSAEPLLNLNLTGVDGSHILFYKDGTTVGSIGTNGSTLYIGSTEGADAHLGFGNQIIRPVTSSGASRDAAIDLGYDGMRFRDLFLSGGIYLGGVGSANKLDDYEEGTWSPTLENVSRSYSDQQGTYTKIGNVVTVRFEIGVTGLDTSDGSAFQIGGFPFTVSASGCLFTMDTENSNVLTNKSLIIGARPNVNHTSLRLLKNNTEYSYNSGTNSSGSIIGMIKYFTNQ